MEVVDLLAMSLDSLQVLALALQSSSKVIPRDHRENGHWYLEQEEEESAADQQTDVEQV